MKRVKNKKIISLGGETGYSVREEASPPTKPKKGWGLTLEVSEIGFSIAMPIVVGALFGLWVDGKFTSHPRATLTGISLGIILAFGSLFQIVGKYSKKDKK